MCFSSPTETVAARAITVPIHEQHTAHDTPCTANFCVVIVKITFFSVTLSRTRGDEIVCGTEQKGNHLNELCYSVCCLADFLSVTTETFNLVQTQDYYERCPTIGPDP